MMTRAEIYALMRSAIGGGEPSSGITLEGVLNWAGRELVRCRPWPWKLTGTVDVEAVAGQGWIELPADWGAGRTARTSLSEPIALVTYEEVERLRDCGIPDGATAAWYIAAYGWSGQATPDAVPKPRLEIWPEPTTDASPTLTLGYDRRWTPLEGDNARPNLPDEMEEALVELARLKVFEAEEYPDKGDASRYEAARNKAWDFYRTVQNTFGQAKGGALSRPGGSTIGASPRVRVDI